jgi:hypothetical protein
MNRASVRILLLAALAFAFVTICGCSSKSYTTSGGAISVQLTQAPPQFMMPGTTAGAVATVTNDKNNAGATWSCSTPSGSACGSFSPTTTGYQIDSLYTSPSTGPANAITIPVTLTATSVADSTKSASTTVNVYVATPALLSGQYAFVLEGFASFGMAGSIVLDGQGNITDGEAEASANSFYSTVGRLNTGANGGALTGTYTVDPTGHGELVLNLNTSCCGTFTQAHSLTVTSSSHALIAENDEFDGLTIGGVGSLDLQTAGPTFSASQVKGGYSFTLTGFSSAAAKASGGAGLNGTWAGIFTANGLGAISGGMFDVNFAGGATHYTSTPFTGAFTAPDTFGRGTMTFLGANAGANAVYSYYIVTPGALRLTVGDQTTANYAGNTGSAFGQGAVGTTNAALTGSYIFSDLGFDVPGNAMGAAGQFKADGSGSITGGIADLNDSGNAGTLMTGVPFTGTYSISGSPRGTVVGPGGQTYNIYLTDPNLNLLDPNNSTGAGGALLLETDATFGAIGLAIPQASPSTATLQGPYAMLLSDQNNPPNSNGGFTGSFGALSSSGAINFSGEGDFQTSPQFSPTPVVGPVSGTIAADTNNPGHFIGTIITTPAFPNDTPIGKSGPVAGAEKVSLYLANSSQGFIVETDTVAPVTGIVEAQDPPKAGAAAIAHVDLARQQQAQGIKRIRGPQVSNAKP